MQFMSLLLQDVGQSILESYSRVMESLAFNIMARIDDLLYVDDATKQRAVSEMSRYDHHGRFGGTLPKQKRISPSPFSIQHNSCASPITLPAFHPTDQTVGRPGGRTKRFTRKSKTNHTLNEELEE